MVFSSNLFILLFLPVFLVIYYLADVKYKNAIATLASVIFFAWGAPTFIFIVFISFALDFYLVKFLSGSDPKRQKAMIALSLILNVGLLLYFKYTNFFIENVNAMLTLFGAEAITWTKIILPVGISFFTFQKMTYPIDVYRGRAKPLEHLSDYILFLLNFPHLIAGPIVQYHEIANQMIDRSQNDTIDMKLRGMFRFVIGLSKKVLIANVLGAKVDHIFALGADELSTPIVWIGIIAYSFQIYFDFSGYSDMAIGIGWMIGFRFPENFNAPYISQSISEFWRRWHITLGRWMKDYLYIPLGGNKVESKSRLYFNLWVVFLISGFWHGASWNFVIWGSFHGLFLIADRMFLLGFLEKAGKWPSLVLTYIVVLIGWVFFRAETLPEAAAYIGKMFAFDFGGEMPLPLTDAWKKMVHFDIDFWVILAFAALFAFGTALSPGKKLQTLFFETEYNLKQVIFMALLSAVLLVLCISAITSSGFNPFIYFRF